MPRSLFAVIPAAGHSRRMGRPKLLLPLGGMTVIARLLKVLKDSQVSHPAVVVRKDDTDLIREVQNAGGWAIKPNADPPEMRQSVEIALEEIRGRFSPSQEDGWMLIPADHPVLSNDVVEKLVQAWQKTSAEILVPVCNGRRGHPTIFSWRLVDQISTIPEDAGLNWLVHSGEVSIEEVIVDDPAIFTDLDTPDDYEALKKAFKG